MKRHRDANGFRIKSVANSALRRVIEREAKRVDIAISESVVESTRKGYASASKDYEAWCLARDLSPYPAEAITLCGWLIDLASHVQISSFGVYCAGVQYEQLMEGHAWSLGGDERIRRTIRWLKRTVTSTPRAPKMPITVDILRTIFPLLPGFPDLTKMAEGDRVFVVASLMGTMGFLRGGEFLSSTGSCRKLLMKSDVRIQAVSGRRALVISVKQPKARPWLKQVEIPIFAMPDNEEFCLVRIYGDYICTLGARSQCVRPALLMPGKGQRALTRDFMVKRTAQLVKLAGIRFVSPTGQELSVRASSWRAGAVRTAISAGVSEAIIKAWGRWSSSAWMKYLLELPTDMHLAAQAMWSHPFSKPRQSLEQRVEVYDTTQFFSSDDVGAS
jgi:hypothetical protein